MNALWFILKIEKVIELLNEDKYTEFIKMSIKLYSVQT